MTDEVVVVVENKVKRYSIFKNFWFFYTKDVIKLRQLIENYSIVFII